MLTPLFKLKQTDEFLVVEIRAPFAKVSETEIEFDGNEFLFTSQPYFLRLYLPGSIAENGKESAGYDSETNTFTIQCPKSKIGDAFVGLDMITELLRPKGKTSLPKLSEVIPGDRDDENEEPEFYWIQSDPTAALSTDSPPVLPKTSTNDSASSCLLHFGYGFAGKRTDALKSLLSEISQLFDLQEIDNMSVNQRLSESFALEREKFSEDHYLADLYDSADSIDELISFCCPWDEEFKHLKMAAPASDAVDAIVAEFTNEETDRLKNLPKRSYLLTQEEMRTALLSLVDILFAFVYDYRTTEAEHSVESAWTICKLSATLSCLVEWQIPEDVILSAFRRALCFPLFRSWKLCAKVLEDVQKILRLGKRRILKCLLDVHKILASSGDYRYILNELYITDYCVWLQSANDKALQWLCDFVANLTPKHADVGLDLEEVELAGQMAELEMSGFAETEHSRGGTSSDSLTLEEAPDENLVLKFLHETVCVEKSPERQLLIHPVILPTPKACVTFGELDSDDDNN